MKNSSLFTRVSSQTILFKNHIKMAQQPLDMDAFLRHLAQIDQNLQALERPSQPNRNPPQSRPDVSQSQQRGQPQAEIEELPDFRPRAQARTASLSISSLLVSD